MIKDKESFFEYFMEGYSHSTKEEISASKPVFLCNRVFYKKIYKNCQ